MAKRGRAGEGIFAGKMENDEIEGLLLPCEELYLTRNRQDAQRLESCLEFGKTVPLTIHNRIRSPVRHL